MIEQIPFSWVFADAPRLVNCDCALKPIEPPKQYYLVMTFDDGDYFLWKTHTNGGPEWCKVSEMGRKKPLRYKTIQTAMRAKGMYTNNHPDAGIEVWNG